MIHGDPLQRETGVFFQVVWGLKGGGGHHSSRVKQKGNLGG